MIDSKEFRKITELASLKLAPANMRVGNLYFFGGGRKRPIFSGAFCLRALGDATSAARAPFIVQQGDAMDSTQTI